MIVGFSPNTTNPRPFNRILNCLDKNIIGEFDTSWKLQPTYLGHLSQIIEKAISDEIWNKIVPVFNNELVTQYQIAKDILKAFNLQVTSIDQNINIPPSTDDLSLFNFFDFYPRTYKEMIDVIIQEVKDRKKFILE